MPWNQSTSEGTRVKKKNETKRLRNGYRNRTHGIRLRDINDWCFGHIIFAGTRYRLWYRLAKLPGQYEFGCNDYRLGRPNPRKRGQHLKSIERMLHLNPAMLVNLFAGLTVMEWGDDSTPESIRTLWSAE